MDARLLGALVFCGAGIGMTAAVVVLLARSGHQLLAGIGGDSEGEQPAGGAETGGPRGLRRNARAAMRGLSNLLAGCLCLATFGFVLHDIATLWDPAIGQPGVDQVVHDQAGLLGWYVLSFGTLYLAAVLILLGFRGQLRRSAEPPVVYSQYGQLGQYGQPGPVGGPSRAAGSH